MPIEKYSQNLLFFSRFSKRENDQYTGIIPNKCFKGESIKKLSTGSIIIIFRPLKYVTPSILLLAYVTIQSDVTGAIKDIKNEAAII